MGFSDFWLLDLYLFMLTMMGGFGLLFAFIGLMLVAFEGRKAWDDKVTAVVLMFFALGLFWPVLLAALPFVAVYRIVTGR